MVNRRYRFLMALGVSCMVLTAFGFTAHGEETGPGMKKNGSRASGIEIERLAAARDTDQVIVVVGSGADSSKVQVAYFRQDQDAAWQEEFYVSGYCGYNGMSSEKREGDRKTPIGTFAFTSAFGIKSNPGSILVYKELDTHDYWVDDSSSRYYNQLVSTKATPVGWNSAEHLMAVNPCYNYSLALNYNEACVPGMGSAIFLHGLHPTKTWTEGCVAIPEEYVMQLIRQADAETKIVIVPDEESLEYIS